MDTVDQKTLLARINNREFSDEESTELPVSGNPPQKAKGETGIWSWNEETQLCIVGDGNFLEVISYEKANEIYETHELNNRSDLNERL